MCKNRLSHGPFGFRTTEELYTGKNNKGSHLKIFGFRVYVHITKRKRTKLDPSSKKGIFVGYHEVSKAFRIYISGFHHIEISRDATFYGNDSLEIQKVSV